MIFIGEDAKNEQCYRRTKQNGFTKMDFLIFEVLKEQFPLKHFFLNFEQIVEIRNLFSDVNEPLWKHKFTCVECNMVSCRSEKRQRMNIFKRVIFPLQVLDGIPGFFMGFPVLYSES